MNRLLVPLLAGAAVVASLWASFASADDIRQEDLDASLIYAAGQGDSHSMDLALALGANLKAVDRHGNNVVLMATQGEQHALLRSLLDKGVNPDARGASGFTPLTYAVAHGQGGDARLLLKAGADANRSNALGNTPLHLAAEFGRNELMAELVAAGARIDAANAAGETPLIAAIRADNRAGLDALLALGAMASVADKSGRSALFWAILENHEGMALALLAHGASWYGQSDGYTPLQMARIMGHRELVAALTQRGAVQ